MLQDLIYFAPVLCCVIAVTVWAKKKDSSDRHIDPKSFDWDKNNKP